MKPIYLICAVPASGKTWACKQLTHKFDWVPHDAHPVARYYIAILEAAKQSTKPILAEAPFRISELYDQLTKRGAVVKDYWILEPLEVCKRRYEQREGKAYLDQHIRAHAKYAARLKGSYARQGTSAQVLAMLLAVP
jgi:hypothetical protein